MVEIKSTSLILIVSGTSKTINRNMLLILVIIAKGENDLKKNNQYEEIPSVPRNILRLDLHGPYNSPKSQEY